MSAAGRERTAGALSTGAPLLRVAATVCAAVHCAVIVGSCAMRRTACHFLARAAVCSRASAATGPGHTHDRVRG